MGEARVTLWNIILLASIIGVALKLAGYLVPQSLLEKPTPARISNLLTVALLAALVGVQTFASSSDIVIDARVPAVMVAAGLFAIRAPFIVVIVAAALVAALIRLFFPV